MAPPQLHEADDSDSEVEMLAVDDALEEIDAAEDADVAMDSDNDGDHDDGDEEITLVNDAIAYFDAHKDSVFAIAQHPRFPALVATGGSEGEADDAPGKGYVVDISAAEAASASAASRRPLLPPSYSTDPASAAAAMAQRTVVGLTPLAPLDGHTDSISALAFTLPNGDFLVSGGLDGRLRVYSVNVPSAEAVASTTVAFLAEAQEVPEISWLAACPAPEHANTVALGASDGSVWVYTLDAADSANPLQIVQSYFLHTASCTAGAWTPDGNLLATVSEDGSLHVWDVWGVAAARGMGLAGGGGGGGQTVVSLTTEDQRFEVVGGLYSVAVSPSGGIAAVGGAGGHIKIVSLPRLGATAGTKKTAAGGKQRAGKPGRAGGPSSSATEAAANTTAGSILASLQVQSDGVETLSFAPRPLTLLAAGSVDGSVTVYDISRSFAVRRHIPGAHDDFSVVKVEWVRSPPGPPAVGPNGPAEWLLTSCGMDGVVRRWDLRGATAAQPPPQQQQQQGGAAGSSSTTPGTTPGLVKEWRGHRGGGEGGGVLGFVQGETGERIVTAGDDGVVLVFEP